MHVQRFYDRSVLCGIYREFIGSLWVGGGVDLVNTA